MDDQTDIMEATPSDRAAEAFEALTREVALLRSAIGGLAGERAAIPDYTQTLGEIAGGVGETYQAVRKLYTAPALKLTPEDVARQITAAGQTACEQDQLLLRGAMSALKGVAGDIKSWMETVRTRRQQNVRLVQAGTAGVLLGALLWAIMPGVVIRQAPVSWAWPEKMAARSLGLSMWDAGERMMRLADPAQWRKVMADRAAMEDKTSKVAVATAPMKFRAGGVARRQGLPKSASQRSIHSLGHGPVNSGNGHFPVGDHGRARSSID